MIGRHASDQSMENELRIANMINEGGLGVMSYYDYDSKHGLDITRKVNKRTTQLLKHDIDKRS